MAEQNTRSKFPHSRLFPGLSMVQRVQAMKSELGAMCSAVPEVPDEALMFKLRDIAAVTNPIAKLLRMIFYQKRLTEEEFYERHRKYKETIGKTSGQINTDKGNLKKTIFAPRLTIKQFERIITMLNYDITDTTFEITDRNTGRSEEFKLSDVNQYVSNCAEDDDTDSLFGRKASCFDDDDDDDE